MEPLREMKRAFPNCTKCGEILAQCYCAASRNEMEALEEYIVLRTQEGVLEDQEHACECGDFYTCDLCRESRDVTYRMRGLMELWGDHWATRLWSAREGSAEDVPVEELLQLQKEVAGAPRKDTATAEPRLCKYGDPTCPCPDGDLCHYEGKDAWPAPAVSHNALTEPVRKAMMDHFSDKLSMEEIASFSYEISDNLSRQLAGAPAEKTATPEEK